MYIISELLKFSPKSKSKALRKEPVRSQGDKTKVPNSKSF